MSQKQTKSYKRTVLKEIDQNKTKLIEEFMTIVMTQRLIVRIKFAIRVILARKIKNG